MEIVQVSCSQTQGIRESFVDALGIGRGIDRKQIESIVGRNRSGLLQSGIDLGNRGRSRVDSPGIFREEENSEECS